MSKFALARFINWFWINSLNFNGDLQNVSHRSIDLAC